jgi:hypothetical protein
MLEEIMQSERADRIAELKSKRAKCSMSRKFWGWSMQTEKKAKVKKMENEEQIEFDFINQKGA